MQMETLTDDPTELLPELTLQVCARKFSEEDVKSLNFAEHKKIYQVIKELLHPSIVWLQANQLLIRLVVAQIQHSKAELHALQASSANLT